MNFPFSMLRDFVDTSLTAVEVGDLLTMAGFEVEGIESVEGDDVLDVKVMANRGDGLSVLGLAREVLAKAPDARPTKHFVTALAGFPIGDEAEKATSERVTVRVLTPECPRYACRLFLDAPNVSAPEWMQKRLRQAGMRPLGFLVDATNYVMLELGQPLHAFDFEKVGGVIEVRSARDGERVTTIDETEHELRSGQMMICDAEKPAATPGIMGGLATEVTGTTKSVLLESANFQNTAIRRLRKELGISTEASYRFERHVDPEGVIRALNRYAMLIAEADGGKSRVPGIVDVYPSPAAARTVNLRMSRCEKLLGMSVAPSDAKSYLETLGFLANGDGEPFTVATPTWRPDVEREEDLIEEIGRVHGYEKIPEKLPEGTTTPGGTFGRSALREKVVETLVRCGYSQAVSYSLEDKDPLDDPWVEKIGPRNPVSEDSAYLRSSLYPGLAQAARRNGARDVHLFEVGRVFCKHEGAYGEREAAAILSTGALVPEHWVKAEPPQADFFSVKGALEEVFRASGAELRLGTDHTDPRLHPTRQAALLDASGKPYGHVGQVLPEVAEGSGLPEETVLAHFFLDALAEGVVDIHMKPISRNPAVRRDMAILISKSVPYTEIESAIRGACGEVLERLWAFDVFEGKGVPEGSHSVAVALQLRKMGENLTDEEANRVRDRAAEALAKLGGTLR